MASSYATIAYNRMGTTYLRQLYQRVPYKNHPLVFLDRDGTINQEVNLLTSENQVVLYKSAIKAIRIFNTLNMPVIIITNQSVIARGLISKAQVMRINNYLYRRCKASKAYINAIFTCPHHPNATLPLYRSACICRKPGVYMLQEAAKLFHTALDRRCYLIGDQTIDIQTGKNAGIYTILVKTGRRGNDKKHQIVPDDVCQNIFHAARLIQNMISSQS